MWGDIIFMMFSFSIETRNQWEKPFFRGGSVGRISFYHIGLMVMWYNNTDFNEVFRFSSALVLSRSYDFHKKKGNARNSDTSAVAYIAMALEIMKIPWIPFNVLSERGKRSLRPFDTFSRDGINSIRLKVSDRLFVDRFLGLRNDKLLINWSLNMTATVSPLNILTQFTFSLATMIPFNPEKKGERNKWGRQS